MLIENLVAEALDNEVFKFSDHLNEKIWTPEGKLKPEIRNNLAPVVIEFIKFLKLPEGVKASDITVTGSLAGYNYSKYSDLDIHVIVDYSKISNNKDFVAEYMGNKRKLWAEANEITVFGYPLEMYAQDSHQFLEGESPQYSLIKDTWLKQMDATKPDVDKPTVLKKAKELAAAIESLEKEHNYGLVIQKSHVLSQKIKNMRTEGIEEGGDFSTNNLVFKALRNGGYLEKLTQIKDNAMTKEFSI